MSADIIWPVMLVVFYCIVYLTTRERKLRNPYDELARQEYISLERSIRLSDGRKEIESLFRKLIADYYNRYTDKVEDRKRLAAYSSRLYTTLYTKTKEVSKEFSN
jgi:hypothetical protein